MKATTIIINLDLEEGIVKVETETDLPGHPKFYEALGKMALTHALKNLDYGDGDALGNFKFSESVTGVPAWIGALIRMTDKWGRIKSIVKRGRAFVKEESLDDTLLDNAIYSVLVLVLKQVANADI